ncbi:MAG: helix-turn-helix domain-containing protein [Lentisphaeria bacterium]
MFDSDCYQVLLDWRLRRIISSLDVDLGLPLSAAAGYSWRRQHRDAHPFREAVLVLRGLASQSLGDFVYESGPGTLFLYDYFETHDLGYPPESPPGTHLWLRIFPDSVNCSLVDFSHDSYSTSQRFFYRFSELIRQLHQTWDDGARKQLPVAIFKAKISAVLNLIFAEMVQSKLGNQEQGWKQSPSSSQQKEVIREVQKYLECNCGKNSDIETLSHLASYSRPHFLRLFQQYSGCRVHEYIDRIRQQRFQLLREQGLAMKVIAAELGFASNAALNHWQKAQCDNKSVD